MSAKGKSEYRSSWARNPSDADVRFGSIADIRAAKSNVRFTPKADICSAKSNVRYVTMQLPLPVTLGQLLADAVQYFQILTDTDP
jgi:hypothetical protein